MAVLDTLLLVDDDETTNYLHTRLLKRLNIARKIEVATNGDEALQYLLAYCRPPQPPGQPCPTLVLLDIKMPVMDGFEFLEQFELIREKLNPDIRIVVLSSSMNPRDTARLKQFPSLEHHFLKPLTENTVNQILSS